MSLLARFLLASSVAYFLLGCGSDGEESGFTRPMLVSVDPTRLEGVSCGHQPGEMRGYVATLYDTTTFGGVASYPDSDCEPSCAIFDASGEVVEVFGSEACRTFVTTGNVGVVPVPERCESEFCFADYLVHCDWFQLPSSDLVDCVSPVGFSFVASGHRYVAEVDGYERDDLVPVAKGYPMMADPRTGEIVHPSWSWTCTRAVIAVGNWDNPLFDCQLRSGVKGGTATTSIRLDTSSLLGSVECGNGEDRVASFEITLDTDAESTQVVECDDEVILTESADGEPLTAGAAYQLSVRGYTTGSDMPRWKTSCYADTRRGVSVDARCDPLTPSD